MNQVYLAKIDYFVEFLKEKGIVVFKQVFLKVKVGVMIINLMEQQELLFQAKTTIREDLSTAPFVRHYMQEQLFTSHMNDNLKIELPFNHLINQIVGEVKIASKHIDSNSRLTSSLLENGRDIYLKKKQYFECFRRQYPIINDTLTQMSQDTRLVFEYSVMALSNLILKLSINMAKISIVIVSKILTPSYLNIFTVSLLFEKFLELQLVKNRKMQSFEEHKQFLKHFPKISVIKMSKKLNPYDIQFIQKSQLAFNKSFVHQRNKKHANNENSSNSEVSNIQLMSFFELQTEDIKKTKRQYRHHCYEAFNLGQTFGLKSPFGFELYLLISQIAIQKMNQFKPDIIIYIQDFDNSEVSIDPKVRGLIINELSQKVQQKIYVFKEFGITQQMKSEWIKNNNQPDIPEFEDQFTSKISQILNKTAESDIHRSFIDQCCNHEDRKISIENFMKQNTKITKSIEKQLQDYYKKQYILYPPIVQKKIEKNKDEKRFEDKLKKIQKTMLDQLTYLSLALMQKSNFDQTLHSFRNHVFPVQFLDKVIKWLNTQSKIYVSEKMISQTTQFYKNLTQKLKAMKIISTLAPPVKESYFFNFLNKKEQSLATQGGNIKIQLQDTFYVAYIKQFIILFLFASNSYSIYRKVKNQKYFTQIKNVKYADENIALSKKYSTFVANYSYIYKAFGEGVQNEKSQIFRFKIQNPLELQQQKWKQVSVEVIKIKKQEKQQKLEQIGSQCTQFQGKQYINQIPIELKRHGYGYSYDTIEKEKRVNITLFGGGFNFNIENQQKVNRYFYLIRNNEDQIFKIGKTNENLVNERQNMRQKWTVYPFVYGVPISMNSNNQLSILSTNGYLQNINHFKKLFLTKVRLGPLASLNSIGIIAQNKLNYSMQTPQIAVTDKNAILSIMIHSYGRINRFGNQVALYNSQGDIYVIKVEEGREMEQVDRVDVAPVDSNQMGDKEEIFRLIFGNKKMILKA